MTIPAKPGRFSTAKQRRAAERARIRSKQAQTRKEVARLAAEAEERRQEAIAPQVQRKGVVAAGGGVYRHPRVEPDGMAFKVSNPVRHLHARGVCTEHHLSAADRLRRAWEDGGREVGMAPTAYGERSGGGNTDPVLRADGTLRALSHQLRAQEEFEAARRWMGNLFGAVQAVALDGLDLEAWATLTKRNPQVAKGYVLAALDRLVEFYRALDQARKRAAGASRIRAAEVVG